MYVIPVKTDEGDGLILVLSKTNVDRMMRHDPIELRAIPQFDLRNPSIMICYEEDTPELQIHMASRNVKNIIRFLMRGFEFRPDLGDHNDGGLPFVFRPGEKP